MEHAATIIGHRRAVLPIVACARLRQGSSPRSSWVLEDAPGGTEISVGADTSCDWQVRAAFVPARAFVLRMMNGAVQVRAEHPQGVLLNGRAIGTAWSDVPTGARLDVGLARIELSVKDPMARGFDPRELDDVPHRAAPHLSPDVMVDVLPRSAGATARLGPPPSGHGYRARSSRPPRSAAATLDALTNAARFEDLGRKATPRVSVPGEVTPALLDDGLTDKPARVRYALVFAVTACAYGGWVALLDYL